MDNTMNTAATKKIEVGTILETSWGYDQTNVDFYEVVKKTARFAVVREIAAMIAEDTAYLVGKKMPIPGKFIGEEIRRKIFNYGNGDQIAISSCANASIWNGTPSLFSSYA